MTTVLQSVIKANSQAKPVCFGIGFVAMDVVEGLTETFAAPGGSCGNVMSMLSWLDWQAYPIARLGKDDPGAFVEGEFSSSGVRTEFLTREQSVKTPVVIQRFVENKAGQRTHRYALTCPDCGGWLPRFRPVTIKQAGVSMEYGITPSTVFLDRISPAALKLAAWARELGALIVFEPSSVGDEKQFQKAVALSHVLKFAHDRLGHVPDMRKISGPDLVIETLGDEGLRFRVRSEWFDQAAYKAPHFVDAAGSGDWCTAMLLDGWIKSNVESISDWEPAEVGNVLARGQAAAAINCGFEGARGAMLALQLATFEKMLEDINSGNSITLQDVLPKVKKTRVNLCGVCDTVPELDNTKSDITTKSASM